MKVNSPIKTERNAKFGKVDLSKFIKRSSNLQNVNKRYSQPSQPKYGNQTGIKEIKQEFKCVTTDLDPIKKESNEYVNTGTFNDDLSTIKENNNHASSISSMKRIFNANNSTINSTECEDDRNSVKNDKKRQFNNNSKYYSGSVPKNIPKTPKVEKSNLSNLSKNTPTSTTRNLPLAYPTHKIKPNPKAIPVINQNTYLPSANKLLKLKIPKLNRISNTPILSKSPNSKTSCPRLDMNFSLMEIYKKEEQQRKSRNDKIKQIEAYSYSLYKRKTFSSDIAKKEKIKKELDKYKTQKELENCTFKPKIRRNFISAQNSINNSPCMTIYNSKENENLSFRNTSREREDLNKTYHKQTEWKNKLKSRNEKEKSLLYNKESMHCSFKPVLGNPPTFEFKSKNKDYTIKQNNLYYERLMRMRKEKKENKLQKEVDYSLKYEQRRRKEKLAMSNSICFTDIGEIYATFDPDKKMPPKFENKKEKLRNELHNFNIDL